MSLFLEEIIVNSSLYIFGTFRTYQIVMQMEYTLFKSFLSMPF